MKLRPWMLAVILPSLLALAAGAGPFVPPVEAAGFSGKLFSLGSRGFGSSKGGSWLSPTKGTWDRRGGGIFGGGKSSGGYSKPTAPSTGSKPGDGGGKSFFGGYSKPTGEKPSSGGYSKPSMPSSDKSGIGTPSTEPKSTGGFWKRLGGEKSSGGYTKPSASPPEKTVRDAPAPTGTAKQSGGYSKPIFGDKPPSAGYSKPVTGDKTPSAGYSKPAGPPAVGSGGYSKPTGAGAVPAGKFSGGSTFDKAGMEAEKKARSKASLDRYKTEQGKFKAPDYKVEGASQSPLADKAKVYSRFDYGNHYGARDGFFRSSGYRPPAYAFNSAPSFGMFDALFLYWMLDHISNKNVAATAYHHADDPGFKKWREDAERQAKDNPDLKTKLDEMDRQIKSMQGTAKDPAYIPPGVPPEAVLSAGVLAAKKAEKPKLRLATGQAGGWYEKFGELFKKESDGLDTTVINTAGSLDNMKLLANGEADLAVIQSDALALWEKRYPEKVFMTEQASLYEEYVQLVANRQGGVSSLREINPRKHVIYVGPSGSGTSLTWAALCEYAPKLKKIPVKNAPYDEALQETVNNPKALMLFVGALRSDFLKKAESVAAKSGNLRLVTVDEPLMRNLKDRNGNSVYKVVEIPASVYPDLQRGWIFSSAVKTVSVTAVLALRSQWAEKFGPEAMEALSVTVLETKPAIAKRVADKI